MSLLGWGSSLPFPGSKAWLIICGVEFCQRLILATFRFSLSMMVNNLIMICFGDFYTFMFKFWWCFMIRVVIIIKLGGHWTSSMDGFIVFVKFRKVLAIIFQNIYSSTISFGDSNCLYFTHCKLPVFHTTHSLMSQQSMRLSLSFSGFFSISFIFNRFYCDIYYGLNFYIISYAIKFHLTYFSF